MDTALDAGQARREGAPPEGERPRGGRQHAAARSTPASSCARACHAAARLHASPSARRSPTTSSRNGRSIRWWRPSLSNASRGLCRGSPVTSPRAIWYEAHLLSDRAGRRAREACERLGPDVHERILADGDRLAQSAALVAQAFYKHAAPVWQALGAEDFGRWFDLGHALSTAEPTQRDAALAFFAVPPKGFAAVGTARLATWCAVGRRVLRVVAQAGRDVLRDHRAIARAHRRRTNRRVGAAGGCGCTAWRAGAASSWPRPFFAAAPAVLPSLDGRDFAPWADLGAALQRVVRETEFFARLPRGLAALEPDERRAVLTDGPGGGTRQRGSRRRAVPRAACRRGTGARRATWRPARRLCRRRSGRRRAPPATSPRVVGALLRDIPAPHRRAAVELLRTRRAALSAGRHGRCCAHCRRPTRTPRRAGVEAGYGAESRSPPTMPTPGWRTSPSSRAPASRCCSPRRPPPRWPRCRACCASTCTCSAA